MRGFVRTIGGGFDRVAEVRPAWLLGISALVFLGLSLGAMSGETSTFDEGVHLAAGYSYVRAHDYRMNPEHPPLAKILAALPLLAQPVRWPADPRAWEAASEGEFGYRLLYLSGNDPDRMLFWGRVPTLLWSVILLVSIYAVARELYGPRGALASLILATFCPNLLAHGHLVTTDVPVAALTLLTLVSFRNTLEQPTLARSLATGILLGGALGAKYNAVFLVPVLGLLAAAHAARKVRSPASEPTGGPAVRTRTALRWIVCTGLFGAAAYCTLWGLYGFRSGSSSDGSRDFVLRSDPATAGLTGRVLAFASEEQVLPAAYLIGFAEVGQHSSAGHSAYALGLHSETGWGWYFPFALLVKTPVATLVFFGWGLAAHLRAGSARAPAKDFLTTPLIVLGVLVVASHLNIGIRHLLPLYPLLMILAGGCLGSEAGPVPTWKGGLPAALLASTIASCLLAAPYFLAYFNLPSRLLFARHEMLADSNLDWGQDLGRLKRYMDREGISKITLAYFGDASPRHLGLRHDYLPGNHNYTLYEKEWLPAPDPRPGDVVAVSASSYVGLGLPDVDHYRRLLGGLVPVATVGHSILVFRIPPTPPGSPEPPAGER